MRQSIIFILILVLFSCTYKAKPVYEEAMKIYNSSDSEKYMKAFKMFDSITYSRDEHHFRNVYAKKAVDMLNKIQEDYAKTKKAELLKEYANTKIAYVKDSDNSLYVMNFDGSDNIKISGEITFCNMPRWSNDGKHIAFESRNDIYIISADGSNMKKIATGENYQNPDWSPDCSKLLYSDDYGKIFVYNMKSKTTTIPDIGYYDGTITSSIWMKNSRDILVFGWGKLLLLKENSKKLVSLEANLPDTEPIIMTIRNLYDGKIFSHGILSRDGNKLLVFINDFIIIDFETKKVLESTGSSRSACMSPDMKYIMGIGGDKIITIEPPLKEDFIEDIDLSNIKVSFVSWSPWLK